jgi:hypothetical protein
MRAIDEVKRLIDKIASGDLPSDEPLFVLRARDCTAAEHVHRWADRAERQGTPPDKISEARTLAESMERWPVIQVPGRPDTRRTIPADGVG